MSNPPSFKNVLNEYVPSLRGIADLVPGEHSTEIKSSNKFILNFSESIQAEVVQSPWTGYFNNKNISVQNSTNFTHSIKATVIFDNKIKGEINPKKNKINFKSKRPKIYISKTEYANSEASKVTKQVFSLLSIQLDKKNNSKCLISFKEKNCWRSKTKEIWLDDLKEITLFKANENNHCCEKKCDTNSIEIKEHLIEAKEIIDPVELINKTSSSFSSLPNCKKSKKRSVELFILNNITQNKIKSEELLKNPKIIDYLFTKFAQEVRKVSHCTEEMCQLIINRQSMLLAKKLLSAYPDLLKILHKCNELASYCTSELLPYLIKHLGLKHCIEALNCNVSPLALRLASEHKAAFQCNYHNSYQKRIFNYHGTKTLLILKKRKIFPFMHLPRPVIQMIDHMQAPHTNPSSPFYPILNGNTNCMQIFIKVFNGETKAIAAFPETTIEEVFYMIKEQFNLGGNLLLKFSGTALLERHKTLAHYKMENSSVIRVVRPTL